MMHDVHVYLQSRTCPIKASPIFRLMSNWPNSAMGQCMPSMAARVPMLSRLLERLRSTGLRVLPGLEPEGFLARLFNLRSSIG